METYISVYLGSTLLALMVTPLVIWVARRIKAVDRPGVRTVHERPIPRIGGLAIFLAAMSLIVCVLFLDNTIGDAFRERQVALGALLCTATFVFLIGLLDDLKGLPARFKFLAEIAAAAVLCCVGIQITAVEVTNGVVLHFGWLACPLTLLWIVGITNAVNLSDGLDGLAAGISAVACAVIAVFAIHDQNQVMAVFMLALLGGLSGFLFYNFNPARIFMGDCGSLFLGYTIASASVICFMKSSAVVGLALPVLALGIPIFDTFLAILRRFLEGRSLFAPDRSHFHHRLIDLGLKQRHAVIAIYAATCIATGLGSFMVVRRDVGSLVVFGCVLILLILLFRVVGAVHFRDTVVRLRERHTLVRRQKHEKRTFEHLQLSFRRTRNFKEWWQVICEAARRLDVAWLSLRITHADGRTNTSVWRGQGTPVDSSHILTMNISLNGAPTKGLMEFEIAVLVNGSLESASHRASLFSRLIEECTLSCPVTPPRLQHGEALTERNSADSDSRPETEASRATRIRGLHN